MTDGLDIKNTKRWVVKIGSALLTDNGRGLNRDGLMNWAEQIATLREQGLDCVLVSSGSVAEGMSRLGWSVRPRSLHKLQAAAAVGQMGLIQAYESCFKQHGLHSAQVLLSHDDLSNRNRYLNARSTLRTLLELGTIPIVNENDTVATEEIRFGDNDTLAAMVANLVEADLLVILTDQDGLFDGDPRGDAKTSLIKRASANDPELENYAGSAASDISQGGMLTKVLAAQKAARSGTHTIIANGRLNQVLLRLSQGEGIGTQLLAEKPVLTARKRWIANQLKANGILHLDSGAVEIITNGGKSLLAVGVTEVLGEFKRGDVVCCQTEDGREIARGLVNYAADECRQIAGKPSDQIESTLGYVDEPELIHRDNLIVI